MTKTIKLFHQCRLSQGNAHLVSWIDASAAKVGTVVELRDLGGLWRVETVCPIPMRSDALAEKQRMDRRGMPDI
jgi:hypothetical protein